MCITGMWNMNSPSDLLLDILSRLSLKANIQASAVCKTWCGAAVSVRKLQPPHPWVFYPLRAAEEGNYLLFDPSRSQTYKLNFPELKNYGFSYPRDGWLLVVTKAPSRLIFLFNPFTRNHIYLPKLLLPTTAGDCCLAFSAAPTSSANCLVISFNYTKGEGAWEEKRELGGLTIFASRLASLTRASSLSSKERNKLYQSRKGTLASAFPLLMRKLAFPAVQVTIILTNVLGASSSQQH